MHLRMFGWFVIVAWGVATALPTWAQAADSPSSDNAEPRYVRPVGHVQEGSDPVIRVVPIPDGMREKYNLDQFYQKVAVVDGIPIIGSEKVTDYALLECAWVIDHMLAGCDRIKAALVDNKVRVGVIAVTEYTMDLPENQTPRMLRRAAYHDRRSRGLGGVRYATCGEENLLSLPGDPYHSENITIHEFAHTIASNLRRADPPWWDRLNQLYDQATNEGLWADTYAATNVQEYWAEATQSWFDCNSRRADGQVHNGVWNRDKLTQYDPRMAEFLAETFGDRPWRYGKTIVRPEETLGHLAGLDRQQLPTFRFENSPRIRAASDRADASQSRPERTSDRPAAESAPPSEASR